MKSDYNKYNINLETISSDKLNKIYNILGKQLHAKHPFENNIIFDKTELEKIFSSIKNLKNQIGSFKNINSAKCCECKQKFLFQESLNIEKSKINKTKEFMPIYCSFCLTQYKIIDEKSKKLQIMPLKVKFSNKNIINKDITLYSNISIKKIIEDIKTKILAIKDFDKIPNDYIEYTFYNIKNNESMPLRIYLNNLFKLDFIKN